MKIYQRHLDSILGGLRLLQNQQRPVSGGHDVSEILTNAGKNEPLDFDELDELCDELINIDADAVDVLAHRQALDETYPKGDWHWGDESHTSARQVEGAIEKHLLNMLIDGDASSVIDPEGNPHGLAIRVTVLDEDEGEKEEIGDELPDNDLTGQFAVYLLRHMRGRYLAYGPDQGPDLPPGREGAEDDKAPEGAMKIITRAEWKAIHRDFKHVDRAGQHWRMVLNRKTGGSELEPVKVEG